MTFHLGLFRQLNSADTLLLAGDPEDLVDLSRRLGKFVASASSTFPIHDLASVSAQHPAQLFASRSLSTAELGFVWLCSPSNVPVIQDQLLAVASSGLGHQYFDLVGTPVLLTVSAGEYGASWWAEYG